MSETKVGDLVMVVRGCPYCENAEDIGVIFTVRWVGESDGPAQCCGRGVGDNVPAADSDPNDDGCYAQSQLIRIDPPAEPATTERKEEFPA